MEPRWKHTAYWRALPRWKQVVLENPDLFVLRYFGHKIDELKDFHNTLINAALTEPRSLILFPAGHGKTTLISTILPILEVCRNPDIKITGLFKNDMDAEGVGQAIHGELLSNELLIRDFGPFRPTEESKPFAITKMSMANRKLIAKEPTISLFGAGSRSALGHRSDWTFCDDIVHDQNSHTPDRRHKLKEWFMQGPATQGVSGDTRLTVVGTRFDPQDLYGDLIELGDPEQDAQIYSVHEYGAILDEDTHEVLWPERRPYKWLMIKKAEMGALDFNKRYRNIAVDESRLAFREQYIKGGWHNKNEYPGCLDREYRVGEFGDNWRRVAGFDTALGATRSAKFCAHVVLGEASCKHHERCFWVIDIDREQWTLPQQVDRIITKHEEYDLLRSVLEANSFQIGLKQAVDDKMDDRGLAYVMEPHYTSRTNKPDPETGVRSMSGWFERGMVHIPWGDSHSKRKMAQFVEELIMYPGRTTDTVMAFWFAWRNLQISAPKYGSFNRLDTTNSVWRGKAKLGQRRVLNPYYAKRPEAA